MKEEILDITKKLYHNHLTPEIATNLLLDLFAVSNSALIDVSNCPYCDSSDLDKSEYFCNNCSFYYD